VCETPPRRPAEVLAVDKDQDQPVV